MSKLSPNEEQKLKNDLKQKGYKLTLQRRAILDIIVKSEGKHLTAEELYDEVKKECPEIGLATVYRTLQLLEEMKILSKLDIGDGSSRYELIHEDENHQHHHLICNNCGKVIEVKGDLLESLEHNIEEKYDFKVLNHSVKFYGLCSECLKLLNKKI